jgi:hypothetical protein
VVSKIFRTDAVKIIKLTIRPIGRHHPRSSSLPHVDTGPTVSSIFGTLPGSPFLSECQAIFAIRFGCAQWYKTGVLSASISFLEIGRSHWVPNQGSAVGGGWQLFCVSPETANAHSLFLSLIHRENRHRSRARLQINACEIFPRPPS